MKTWQSLGYLGLIPLFISVLLSVLILDWQHTAIQVFIFYSAVILSFISGTLWRVCKDDNNPKQQIISNIFCLVAFSSLLLTHAIALIILALGYLQMFLYEKAFVSHEQKVEGYLNMRFTLTLIVIFLHASAFITLL